MPKYSSSGFSEWFHIVLKIFKRVPKNDLETIFPNAEPKMSLTDKHLLWIPAIGQVQSIPKMVGFILQQ